MTWLLAALPFAALGVALAWMIADAIHSTRRRIEIAAGLFAIGCFLLAPAIGLAIFALESDSRRR